MPAVAVTTIDTAGGIITGQLQTFVTSDGIPMSVLGDPVAPHPPPLPPHFVATMAQGSVFVKIDGIPVVRAGDAASCGHTASGSSHVSISE
ncbi:MAG: hypothetical protein BV459_00540 [Thermoplasmata archaeon M11B2D]|nr:MAG: hypothetical protein BV459_00540 [Thermoplasmata archaeon M11B2D]